MQPNAKISRQQRKNGCDPQKQHKKPFPKQPGKDQVIETTCLPPCWLILHNVSNTAESLCPQQVRGCQGTGVMHFPLPWKGIQALPHITSPGYLGSGVQSNMT